MVDLIREKARLRVQPSGPNSAAFKSRDELIHEGEWNGEYADLRPSWTYYRCGLSAPGWDEMQFEGQVACIWCITRSPRVDWRTQQ